jgi:phage tail-like protein
VSLVNPVANNNFSVFLFDAAPLDTSVGGLLEAGAGLALGAAKTAVFGSFSDVSGLEAGVETEEYREGGFNAAPRVFPKWGTYGKVVLKRGTTPDFALWDWYYQVLRGETDVLRKNGLIVLTDKGLGISAATGGPALGLPVVDKLPVAVWYLTRGMPERIQGPTLSGSGNEVAVESVEIAHEGLVRVGAAMVPGLGDNLARMGL